MGWRQHGIGWCMSGVLKKTRRLWWGGEDFRANIKGSESLLPYRGQEEWIVEGKNEEAYVAYIESAKRAKAERTRVQKKKQLDSRVASSRAPLCFRRSFLLQTIRNTPLGIVWNRYRAPIEGDRWRKTRFNKFAPMRKYKRTRLNHLNHFAYRILMTTEYFWVFRVWLSFPSRVFTVLQPSDQSPQETLTVEEATETEKGQSSMYF